MKITGNHLLSLAISLFIGAMAATGSAQEKEDILFALDFQKPAGMTIPEWMTTQGIVMKDGMKLEMLKFDERGLHVSSVAPVLGLLGKKVKIEGGKNITIEWGVTKFPAGADWEKGIKRESIGVMLSFGDKKIEGVGPFGWGARVPWFIGFFLGEKDPVGKAMKGNYYHKAGRYVCLASASKEKEFLDKTFTTKFNYHDTFKAEFGLAKVPHVSAIGLEIDTRGTKGNSSAFIRSIKITK